MFGYAKALQLVFNLVAVNATPQESFSTRMNSRWKLNEGETYGEVEAIYFTWEDATFVFLEVDKYGIAWPKGRNLDHRYYIRLYGLLAAAYNYRQALDHLARLSKFQQRKQLIQQVDSCKVIQVRHLLASHPLNATSENRSQQTRLIQLTLDTNEIQFVSEDQLGKLRVPTDLLTCYTVMNEATYDLIKYAATHWLDSKSNAARDALQQIEAGRTHFDRYLKTYAYADKATSAY